MHVEQVLAGIPGSERCSCPPRNTRKGGGLVARLFGNRRPYAQRQTVAAATSRCLIPRGRGGKG